MAKLHKLRIGGIRSFGPEDADFQLVTFHSPVTLFLGQNGCGKTTLIEALKFAATGDLPSGKGQNFVHDPKLGAFGQTKGQVKLQICNTATNDRVTVIKSLVSTQRAGSKMEYKTLDSTLVINGKSISGKCADITAQFCWAFGVPKSILENVIFCHQDDSLWPMDEPKRLKDKFDLIFDSASYVDCIDEFRRMRKQGMVEARVLREQTAALAERRAIVLKSQRALKEKGAELQRVEGVAEQCRAQLQPLSDQMDQLQATQADWEELKGEERVKQAALEQMVAAVKEMEAGCLSEFEGTDDELQDSIRFFSSDTETYSRQLTNLQRQERELDARKRDLAPLIQSQLQRIGQLEEERRQHRCDLRQREARLRECAAELNTNGGAEGEKLDVDSDADRAVKELRPRLDAEKARLDGEERRAEAEEARLRQTADDCRAEVQRLEQALELKGQQDAVKRKEIRNLKFKLQEIASSDSELSRADTKLQRIDADISTLESAIDLPSLRASITADETLRQASEARLDELNAEIRRLQDCSAQQTELDLKREEMALKKGEIARLSVKSATDLSAIFDGNSLPEEEEQGALRAAVERARHSAKAAVARLGEASSQRRAAVARIESELKCATDRMADLQLEISTSEQSIQEACDGGVKSYTSTLDEARAAVEAAEIKRSGMKSAKFFYETYLQEFRKRSPCCPLCRRGFQHDSDTGAVDEIIARITAEIAGIPSRLQMAEKKLLELRAKYDHLCHLKPLSERTVEMRSTTIPEQQQRISQLETSLNSTRQQLEDVQQQLSEPTAKLEAIGRVAEDVTLLDRCQQEVRRLQHQVDEIESRLPLPSSSTPSPSTTVRSIPLAMSERDDVAGELKRLQRSIESSRSKLHAHSDRLERLRRERNDLAARQLSLQRGLVSRSDLDERLRQLEAEIATSSEEVKQQRSELTLKQARCEDAKRGLEEARRANKAKRDGMLRRYMELKRRMDEVQLVQENVERYRRRGVEALHEEALQAHDQSRADLEAIEVERRALQQKAADIEAHVNNADVKRKQLADNLLLREKRRLVGKLQRELDDLQTRLASSRFTRLQTERQALQKRREELLRDVDRAEGQREELQRSVADLKELLDQEQYANAVVAHRKKFIEYKLNDVAGDDLRKIIAGMEFALSKHHEVQMRQINELIRDYWRKIYRGNDIDYIEIRTEVTTTSATNNRRSYAYRLVQVRHGVELEMRGRCSAGQRVLACLIVRLALAEAFSANCGIFCLDEPTTNLDRENMQSLCSVLADLIVEKRRTAGGNFQMVIITHDEDFVGQLSTMGCFETFYRVRRNAEGRSRIDEVRAD